MSKGKHISGGKVSDSHSSVIDAAVPVVKAANKQHEVTNIVLGPINQGLPPGQKRIKFVPINGGLKVTIRGSGTAQDIYVYTNSPPKTERALQAAF